MIMIDEINSAVRQALMGLSPNAGWRTYTGVQQQTLVDSLCELLGTQHVELACSGTAALEMLLRACRLRSGEEVLLAGYDYPGNFAAIERVGALPALVDVSPNSWRLDWDSLDATYTPQCRVLIASHLHGQLQEMERLQRWCRSRGVWLIQDACQALGASIDGTKLGQASDATFISFGGSKTISAGRGGAWSTNDDCLAQHARLAAGVGSGAFHMSELQAAVVLAQLPFLDRITARTREFFFAMLAEMSQKFPGAIAPWAGMIATTAFYQAGWILEDGQAKPDHAGDLPIELGKGFDGFHRRSTRRCRVVGPLSHTASISQRTCTAHHQVALGSGIAFQPGAISEHAG